MKKNSLYVAVLGIVAIATSCGVNRKHVIISTNDNGDKTTLEYYGTVAFTDDRTAIKYMAPHSKARFEEFGNTLIAERNHDAIQFRLNGGDKTTTLNDEGKQLLADVIRKEIKLDKH
jgi:hypothetical protein